MTATPSPNGYLDLYSLMYCIDRGRTLGESIYQYKKEFFECDDFGYRYRANKFDRGRIDKIISPYIFRIKSTNPVPVEYIDININLPNEVMDTYYQLENNFFLVVNEKVIDVDHILTQMTKLRQICAGYIYIDDVKEWLHDKKIHEAGKIKGPVIIVYEYRFELERFLDLYPDAVHFNANDSVEILHRWNAGKIDRLLLHAASAGKGINLQNVCYKMVWLTLSYSLENYIQTCGRIARQGQNRTVQIYHLLVPDTIDWLVMQALQSKGTRQERMLNALDHYQKLRDKK